MRVAVLMVVAMTGLGFLTACASDPSGADDDETAGKCGDALCAAAESAASCPADCPSVCGDGTCSDDEPAASCSVDCDSRCGDQFCSAVESAMSCPTDCPSGCGDLACTHQETAATCSLDCPAFCGDDACTVGENAAACPADCASVCGDGSCTMGESASSCSIDCAAGCGDSSCTHTESFDTCAQDCPSVCNDGMCASGETCSSCASDCGVCLPPWVDITLVGALIRPAMIDGRTWDGPDLTPAQIDELADLGALLAGAPQYGDVLAFLTGMALNAYAPPEPFGTAEITVTGSFNGTNVISLATVDNNYEDTITPEWPGTRGWLHVPTSAAMRIRVILEDEDLLNHDVIGTVELNEADLRRAWNAQNVLPVPVYMQGVAQVLYLTVSVTLSTPPPVCGGACEAGTYTACTCAGSDPCGWSPDGTCDSYCSMNFPSNHFDDSTDCTTACSADCQAGTYSACSCSSADPCGWQNDATCDASCAADFPSDHFHDALDCP